MSLKLTLEEMIFLGFLVLAGTQGVEWDYLENQRPLDLVVSLAWN